MIAEADEETTDHLQSEGDMRRTSPPPDESVAPPKRSKPVVNGGEVNTTQDDQKLTWTFQPADSRPEPAPKAASSSASMSALNVLPKPVTTSLLPTYKILLIGDAAVGKSNLLLRFANNTFDIASRSTIGVEFVSRELELPTERDGSNERVNVQLWDTAGQERCGAISAAFFRGAKGVVVVYDRTRFATLRNVPGWVAHAKQYADENCSFVVVGNKTDLKNLQTVSDDEAEGVAHSLGVRHFDASALTGEGVPSAFLHLILSVNSLMRAQQFASPKLNSAAGGGRRASAHSSLGSGPRVPVDISGFGNTGNSHKKAGCCR